jgi:hypothetical protein
MYVHRYVCRYLQQCARFSQTKFTDNVLNLRFVLQDGIKELGTGWPVEFVKIYPKYSQAHFFVKIITYFFPSKVVGQQFWLKL